MWEYILWGVVFIITLIAEAATVAFVSIWLSVGAVAAFLVSVFGGSIAVQCVVFVLVSLALFVLTRPFVKKFGREKPVPTNADSVIGMEGVVRQPIEALNGGRVSVNGLEWSARAADGMSIPVGARVTVEKIEGATLLVHLAEMPKEA